MPAAVLQGRAIVEVVVDDVAVVQELEAALDEALVPHGAAMERVREEHADDDADDDDDDQSDGANVAHDAAHTMMVVVVAWMNRVDFHDATVSFDWHDLFLG